MKLAVIGFGQAGGKITDKFLDYDARTGSNIVRAAVAINTASADLQGLRNIPRENRVLIGQTRVKGHGVGADNELGAEVAMEDINEIQNAIDGVPVHEIDAFLIIAGLGGGTGSGGLPVLASHLKRIYAEPVYGLGILPATDEGGIYTLNAARSLRTCVEQVDNLFLFDNDAWRTSGESVKDGYETSNDEIVRRFGTLFSAGEVAPGGAVAESVVDSSEIINTLAGGGISTIGYAVDPVELPGRGLLSRFKGSGGPDETDTTNRITSLVRKAALGRLTVPCDISHTERALLVVAGPSAYLNRKGIERGRKWLEEETGSMEIRGGDYPLEEPNVAAVVLLSGIHNASRIKELQRVAIEAQDNIGEIRRGSASNLDALVTDDDNRLQPLF
jgi:cell division GTPase FtsZ